MSVIYKSEGANSLGSIAPKRPARLFCTISPSTNAMVRIIRQSKTVTLKSHYDRIPYGSCNQRTQVAYCIDVLMKCYVQFLFKDFDILGTYELNKQGNVHLHFIIFTEQFKTDYSLIQFQRDIKMCEMVVSNRKQLQGIDYMNSIVRITEPLHTIFTYMSKDDEQKDIFNWKSFTLSR